MTDPGSLQDLKNYHDKYGCGDPKPEFSYIPSVSGFVARCNYKKQEAVSDVCKTKRDAQRDAASKMLKLVSPQSVNVRDPSPKPPASVNTRKFISPMLNLPVPNPSPKHSASVKTQKISEPALKLTDSQRKKAASFIKKFENVAITSDKNKPQSKKEGILSDVNLGFKKADAPQSSLLKKIKSNYDDAVDHFVSVMENMNINFRVEISENKQDEENRLVFLRIGFNGITTAGLGKTNEEAVYSACKNMIEMLLIFCE